VDEKDASLAEAFGHEFRDSDRAHWRAGEAPLARFLGEERIGDCTYHATAVALLLRTLGVPTRLCVGYLGVRWDPDLGMWTGPFVMAALNSRVVRRTHALLDRSWGADFRYRKAMSTGAGPAGLARALGVATGTRVLLAGAMFPAARRLLRHRLPQPGQGPSAQTREKGCFVVRILGIGYDRRAERFVIRGSVRGDRDPGYGSTAIMLAESALALALQRETVTGRGGVLTPATALGMPLCDRLRAAGIRFEVSE